MLASVGITTSHASGKSVSVGSVEIVYDPSLPVWKSVGGSRPALSFEFRQKNSDLNVLCRSAVRPSTQPHWPATPSSRSSARCSRSSARCSRCSRSSARCSRSSARCSRCSRSSARCSRSAARYSPNHARYRRQLPTVRICPRLCRSVAVSSCTTPLTSRRKSSRDRNQTTMPVGGDISQVFRVIVRALRNVCGFDHHFSRCLPLVLRLSNHASLPARTRLSASRHILCNHDDS